MRAPLRLELEAGQWRGQPPRGPLTMVVVGISRSTTPGWAIVSGWRQFPEDPNEEPRFCRVLVRRELLAPQLRRR